MSEPYGSWDAPGEPQAQRSRKGLVTAIVAAVLGLAVIGATAGWLLADRTAGDGSTPPPTSSPATPGESEPPVAEPSVVPTAASVTPAGFPLPDVRDTDFEQARKRLRSLNLGVQVFFAASGDDRTVERTVPPGGQLVRQGITVKLYVRGKAPLATVPSVLGLPCNQAGSIVADHGLTPQYPTGRQGVVVRQDPEATDLTVHWNQTVRLYCGTPVSASPKPSS